MKTQQSPIAENLKKYNTSLYVNIHEQSRTSLNSYHAHPDGFELIYVLEGASTFIIENREYPVEKNDLIILRPGEAHVARD